MWMIESCFHPHTSPDSDLLPWAGNIFTTVFVCGVLRKAAGLAWRVSFHPVIHISGTCSHVARITDELLHLHCYPLSASGGSYSTCCALSLLSSRLCLVSSTVVSSFGVRCSAAPLFWNLLLTDLTVGKLFNLLDSAFSSLKGWEETILSFQWTLALDFWFNFDLAVL